MIDLLLTLALFNLLAVMAPGPDFAIVVHNTLAYSRKQGLFTALGVSSSVLIHTTYCSLGVALIIAHSPLLFNVIKLIGGSYLIYMGITALRAHTATDIGHHQHGNKHITNGQAFRQGLITNLVNPKCMLFFLAIFTLVIRDTTFQWIDLAFILTFFTVTLLWFTSLCLLLSHPKVENLLQRWQPIIVKVTGVCLIAFGIALYFARVQA
jgi:RhtB (resistance to homoserine/threonine) family protein